MDIAASVAALRARVDDVAAASGRAPGSVRILGVTKTQPREAVVAAIRAGLADVGENYVQEARAKYVGLPAVRTHFIGHVQTNKAKAIAAFFDVVQSVDRLAAGLALARAAAAMQKPLRVLVQVNISAYERFGAAPQEAPALARRLRDEGLAVDGVMAIGPQHGNVEAAFDIARTAYEGVGGSTFSLGMSDDWERAVAYGSTMIRIGSAIFGPRAARESAIA
ncbi:MAG: YggS family pyridoxal phosphate-dependent enzyme [Candidatus Velthaea sp.]